MKEILSYISENKKISIRAQCELLAVNRSSVYYQPVPESEENLVIMRLMDEHHPEHPTHVVLQIQDYLFSCSFIVNTRWVRRLLRLMGIMALYPKRNLSTLGLAKYIRPYLLRGLEITRPNQIWGIDITYITMAKGFMYMTAIIDLYNRYVVGWDVFNNFNAENTLSVLKEAMERYGKPKIINSDQGSQFTSALYTEFVEQAGIRTSMDGKGRATDNIFIERFWRSLKQDNVYLRPAERGTELFLGLKKYVNYYNNHKTHQGIVRNTLVELYKQVA